MAAVADEVARRLVAAIGAVSAAREAAGPDELDSRGRVSVPTKAYAASGAVHPALCEAPMGRRGGADAKAPRPLGYDVAWDWAMREAGPPGGCDKMPAVAVAPYGLQHWLRALQHADLLGDRPSAPTAFAMGPFSAGWCSGRFGFSSVIEHLLPDTLPLPFYARLGWEAAVEAMSAPM